jgi:hypothetical protein
MPQERTADGEPMDGVSMLQRVVTEYFSVGHGYKAADPAEAIVDHLVEEALLAGAIKVYVAEKLLGDFPKYTSMASREQQARRTALVYLWREFVLLLSDALVNAYASQFLATYPRMVKRYGEYALLLAALALQHTIENAEVSPRIRVSRTVRELGLPKDPPHEERAALVVRLLERRPFLTGLGRK